MSVVVVGGNDRMATRYKEVCKAYRHKAKVFTQMGADFDGKIGTPDMFVLFTDTVSHKMTLTVKKKAMKEQIPLVVAHSASLNSLKNLLEQHK